MRHTETAQQPVPRYLLCSLCLFLSDFRNLVRYKTGNNKREGKDFGCSKVILTLSPVTEVFISVDSLEIIVGMSVPFWCQNPPPH